MLPAVNPAGSDHKKGWKRPEAGLSRKGTASWGSQAEHGSWKKRLSARSPYLFSWPKWFLSLKFLIWSKFHLHFKFHSCIYTPLPLSPYPNFSRSLLSARLLSLALSTTSSSSQAVLTAWRLLRSSPTRTNHGKSFLLTSDFSRSGETVSFCVVRW